MLSERNIILEVERIQNIIDKNFICEAHSLKEALDNLRIMVGYQTLDIECLRRELKDASQKK